MTNKGLIPNIYQKLISPNIKNKQFKNVQKKTNIFSKEEM